MKAEKSNIDFDIDLDAFRRESDASIEQARSLGLYIPDFSVDLSAWLTVKQYAETYGVSTQEVSDWIEKGIIPADCTMVLPELNDIRLARNRVYK